MVEIIPFSRRINELEQQIKNPPLKTGGPGGTSGGMDGWQTSVETRLGSIGTDLRDLRSDIKDHRSVAALVAFQAQIQTFLKIPH